MTTARKDIVDVDVTPWYHCISKCVRSAFLMADDIGTADHETIANQSNANGSNANGPTSNGSTANETITVDAAMERKQWIEERLQLLAENFAIGVGGFSVLDNHLHVLVRLDPDDAQQWSAQEVVRRWIAVYPPRNLDQDDPGLLGNWVQQQAGDREQVQQWRQRLSDLGWFMKALKEPLARMCNKADGVRGAFWEARYKSIAVLDSEALLATAAYIDLNPLAAGIAATPERSRHTSIKQRVQHAVGRGKLEALKAARQGSVAGSRAIGNLEQLHWLVPIEDRRQLGGEQKKASSKVSSKAAVRAGMLDSFSLGSYLLLVEYTGRLFRQGKARISAGVKDIFERLDTSVEFWNQQMAKMLSSGDLRGNAFGGDREAIKQLAAHRGKRTANLSPQPAA